MDENHRYLIIGLQLIYQCEYSDEQLNTLDLRRELKS